MLYIYIGVLTKGFDRKIKQRILKYLVWSVVLSGLETWTLLIGEAFEMLLFVRMERIRWTERAKNETVLQRVGVEVFICG